MNPRRQARRSRHGVRVCIASIKDAAAGYSESKFNDGCKASISFQNDGSFYGTRSGVIQTINAAFEYSDTSVTRAQLRRDGVADDTLVQELLLYPTLRCKGIKRQRIDYTVNVANKSLEWATKPSDADGMERVRVKASRLAGPLVVRCCFTQCRFTAARARMRHVCCPSPKWRRTARCR